MIEPVNTNVSVFILSPSPPPLLVSLSSVFPVTFLHHLSLSVSLPVLVIGEHLRICPQGYTCCTSDMEDNLATLSRREMEGLLKDAGRSLQTSLTGQFKAFNGEFVYLQPVYK